MTNESVIIAYVPVISANFLALFERLAGRVTSLYILGEELIAGYDHLRKDLRRLRPEEAARFLRLAGPIQQTLVLDLPAVKKLQLTKPKLIMVDDEISSILREKYFPDHEFEYDNSVFLRYNPENSLKPSPIHPDHVLAFEDSDLRNMQEALMASERGRDWWRQVGCLIKTVDGREIVASNHHLPSDYVPYIDGNARSNFKKGVHLEAETVLHAEASAITLAAQKGIPLLGAKAYSSTFPCPACAKLLANSGISTLFYQEGYGLLDAHDILKAYGISIVFIN